MTVTTTPRTFTAIIERDTTSGWWAIQCEELPAAISQGRTRAEALENLKDAIRLVLEDLSDDERWRQRFAATQEPLAEIAVKVRADIAAGRVEDRDPTDL